MIEKDAPSETATLLGKRGEWLILDMFRAVEGIGFPPF